MNRQPDNTSPFPYHPAYGLPDEVREHILRDAEATSVAAAAEKHKVSLAAIYNWRKALKRKE